MEAAALAALAAASVLLAALAAYHLRKRLDMRDRSAVIAGAALGIGRQVALQLGAKGVKSLLLLDVLPLDDVRAEIAARYPHVSVRTCVCDVADADSVQMAVGRAEGPVSILVNCAGVVSGRRFDELDAAQFKRTMDVNLLGSFLLLKGFLPGMKQRGDGAVVLMSSLMGLMGGARLVDYCASKFAVVGLAEALRLEGTAAVAVAVLCPYVVDTGMFRGAFEATWHTRLVKRAFPFLSAERVAAAAVFTAERGLSVTRTVPAFFGPLVGVARCLPSPVYEAVLLVMGGDRGMDSFVGRGSGAADKAKKRA